MARATCITQIGERKVQNMPSVIDDRIHWTAWAEWCNEIVKDAAFCLRALEAERFCEGERGRLGLVGAFSLDDAIRRVKAVAELINGAASDFENLARSPVRVMPEPEEEAPCAITRSC